MLLPILLQMCSPAQTPDILKAGLTDADRRSVPAATAMAVETQQVAPLPRTGGLVIFGPVATPNGGEVSRAPDGLFYVTAIVNGAPVRFIVDTGATMVVLNPADAKRVGVAPDEQHFNASAQTAGGNTAMARVTLHEIVVGDKHMEGIDAAVVRGDLPVSLLGQNWLSRLDSLTISGDRLHFR